MNEWLLRGLLAPCWVRWLAGLLISLLLTLVLFLLVVRQLQENEEQLRRAIREQRRHYHQQLLVLSRQPGLAALQNEIQRRQEILNRREGAFSVATLLQQSGGQLLKWQPQPGKAELELQLSWLQLKQVFAYFAEHGPLPKITRFSVRPNGEVLQATFQLETTNEMVLDQPDIIVQRYRGGAGSFCATRTFLPA